MKNYKTCRSQWLRHILFIGLGFIVCMLLIVGTQLFYRWKLVQRLDLEGLETEVYDVAYITSDKCKHIDYSVMNGHYHYPVQPYVYRNGRDSVYEVEEVLHTLIRDDNQLKIVYLELDPSYHNTEDIIALIAQQTDTLFNIVLRPYSLQEWETFVVSGRSEEILEETRDLSERLVVLGNTNVFYYGNKEWLTDNPMYFLDTKQLTMDALMEIYLEINMNSIAFTSLTPETLEEELTIPTFERDTYINLHGKNIYYLGDSMYGKDKNQSGIPEIASSYLNAICNNWGIMGTSIAGETENDYLAMVEKLIEEVSEVDIIVLRYGFNDYSGQASLDDDAAFVTNFVNGIEALKASYPNTRIVVSTPTISSVDYEFTIELKEYVNKIQELSEQADVYCLNNYNAGVFTEGDPNTTLVDGVHYNVKGRFYQAERLASYITSIFNEAK